MQAAIGDRLCIRGTIVGTPDKVGEILEVKGKAGEPPYLVRFDDGHTGLVFPGPDAVVEAKKGRAKPASRGKGAPAGARAKGSSARGSSARGSSARKKSGK